MSTTESAIGYTVGAITIAGMTRFTAMMGRADGHPPVICTMFVMMIYGRWAIEIVDGLLCGEYGRTRLSSGWVLVSLAVMPLLAMMMARKQGRSIHHEIIWLGAAAYTPSIIAIEAYLLWRGE